MTVKESLIAKQNEAIDEIRHLLKDWNDRLVFNDLNIPKCYIEGKLEIVVNFRSWKRPEKYYAFVNWIPSGEGNRKRTTSSKREAGRTDLRLAYRYETLMFLSYVEPMKNIKNFSLPSLVWFKAEDEIDGVNGKMLYFSLCSVAFKFINVPGNRKERFMDKGSFAIGDSKSASKIVQRSSKMRNCLVHKAHNGVRNLCCENELQKHFSCLRIDLFDNSMGIRVKEGSDSVIDVLDILIGPFNL